MYVRNYKLNNSYIVIVNYNYVHECKKVCDQIRKDRKEAGTIAKPSAKAASKKVAKNKTPKTPINTPVFHKKYGNGKVIGFDECQRACIEFAESTIKFILPDAFEQGHLVRI